MGLQSQPVFVLSLPRSGSSWVGLILGAAPNARYLREPFTQGHPAINAKVVFDPAAEPELDPIMRELAEKTLSPTPDFDPKILLSPEQWTAENSPSRRLVIKEVNPRACRWFVEHYQPRVVFLLRHPAAVCLSSEREGWLGSTPDDWKRRGLEDGESLRFAWDFLKGNPNCTLAFYESLCENPLGEFWRLYDFCGLTWNAEVEDLVIRYSRASIERRDAWRRHADPDRLALLRESFEAAGLDWYREEDCWNMDDVALES